jgi:hypothetical protein
MLSKTQFKEWFDRYKHAELAAIITAFLGSQFSRIFSGLTTAYLITFAVFYLYSVIIGMATGDATKKNRATQKKTILKLLMIIKTC